MRRSAFSGIRTKRTAPSLAAREAAEIVYGEKMEEGVSGATILLNAATTENAFGDKQRARSLFGQAKRVLERELPAGDKRLAGLYNNMASLYSEEDPERALAYFEKALAVLSAQDVPDCEAAVTYVNMAARSTPGIPSTSGSRLYGPRGGGFGRSRRVKSLSLQLHLRQMCAGFRLFRLFSL